MLELVTYVLAGTLIGALWELRGVLQALAAYLRARTAQLNGVRVERGAVHYHVNVADMPPEEAEALWHSWRSPSLVVGREETS